MARKRGELPMAVIWSFPGEENRKSNPYTSTLIAELRNLGHVAFSPDWPRRLLGRCDIIHLHWPQKVVQDSLPRSLRSIALWLAFLALQKARGARIVWTIHNAASHEAHRPRLERWWMTRLLGLVDGIHALSDISLREAGVIYPAVTAKHRLVAPHWTYDGAYPAAAQRPEGPETIAFLGDLKAYKGLDALLAALESAPPDSRHYLVHGLPADGLDPETLTARLQALRRRGWHIDYVLERLSDQEMADRLAQSRLLVLPYHSGENSGLAVLAAERGTPMLVSALPAFEPMLEELGAPRAAVIEGPLTHAQIARAFEDARDVAGKVDREFVARRAPGRIVREISNYYLFLMEQGTPSPQR
ncbi:glycosyltransferase [Novosphingobium sp. BL-8A]